MIREDTHPVPSRAEPDQSDTAPLTITSAAADKLNQVMAEKGLGSEEGLGEAGLRAFVTGGGCSGLQYGLGFETEAESDDLVFTSAGIRLYVDPVSIDYLQGATIDYEDNLMGGGFKIENPNAVTSCGCGHSFRSADDEPSGAGGGGSCC